MDSFLCQVVLILLRFYECDSYDSAAAGALDLNAPFCAGIDVQQAMVTVSAVDGGGRH